MAWSLGCEHHLLSGDASGEVRVWDVRRPGGGALLDYNASARAGRRRPAGGGRVLAHDAAVTGLLALPGGLRWLSAGRDGRVRLWDAGSRANLMVHYPGAAAPSRRPVRMAATEDGRWLFHPCGTAVQVGAAGLGAGKPPAGARVYISRTVSHGSCRALENLAKTTHLPGRKNTSR